MSVGTAVGTSGVTAVGTAGVMALGTTASTSVDTAVSSAVSTAVGLAGAKTAYSADLTAATSSVSYFHDEHLLKLY